MTTQHSTTLRSQNVYVVVCLVSVNCSDDRVLTLYTKMVPVKSHNDLWSRRKSCDWTGQNPFQQWAELPNQELVQLVCFVIHLAAIANGNL